MMTPPSISQHFVFTHCCVALSKRTPVRKPLHGAAANAGMDNLTAHLASWLDSQAENTGHKLVSP